MHMGQILMCVGTVINPQMKVTVQNLLKHCDIMEHFQKCGFVFHLFPNNKYWTQQSGLITEPQ